MQANNTTVNPKSSKTMDPSLFTAEKNDMHKATLSPFCLNSF